MSASPRAAAANGELQAIEVLVFPEAMRGAGEGHYPWDLEPGSMMTNGTVTGAVQATSGRELSMSFKGGSNKIVVPPSVPIVTFAPAERADLKPGAPVMFGATKNAEGKLAASRVTVEQGRCRAADVAQRCRLSRMRERSVRSAG